MYVHSTLPLAAALLVSAALPAYNTMRPTASVGGAYGITAVADTPAPKPSGECDCGCGGRGYVGDGTIKLDCGCPSSCSCKGGKGGDVGPSCCDGCEVSEDAPLPVEETSPVVRMSGPRWTFESRGTNPPDSFKRDHLRRAHGLDGEGLSSSELSALHDNAHNYGDAKAFGLPSLELPEVKSSNGSCPSGNCPSSSSGRSTVRRGLFGRWR